MLSKMAVPALVILVAFKIGRRRKCGKATPLLLKETSRKFLTTHLAMLSLREAG